MYILLCSITLNDALIVLFVRVVVVDFVHCIGVSNVVVDRVLYGCGVVCCSVFVDGVIGNSSGAMDDGLFVVVAPDSDLYSSLMSISSSQLLKSIFF